ncbi:UNVERIFIED_CONTAM: Biotin/lipoate A/B protein ligase [Siphonaria sp. JEL0065]|nr:Biotin/lipoate A/B protein ligase [Siphonaria sp. JEL0065]
MRSLKIPLIRRRSGGGTVVHNLGNTNYTCFMPRDAFNRDSSAKLVANALHELDIPASVNTRHDIIVEGMKVSGSAFKVVHEKAYAHGTMLISSDLKELSELLRSKRKSKIVGKGVESFPSKVTRLIDHSYTVTHTDFCRAVAEEYGRVFNGRRGLKNEMIELTLQDYEADSKMKEYFEEIQTHNWKFGQTPTFTHEIEKKFSWGHLKVTLTVTDGIIALTEVSVNSLTSSEIDANALSNAISVFLVNTPYDDGSDATWSLLNDIDRWRMSVGGNDSADHILEWLRSEIWSGVE